MQVQAIRHSNSQEVIEKEQVKLSDVADVANFCESDSREDEIYCVRDWIKRHFKYVLSDRAGPAPTMETLNNGGDCDDWAKVYSDIFEMMGYESEMIDIPTTEELGHSFLVLYWNNGYCTIDMLTLNCYNLM